ncbi:MAG: RNA-binding protein [Candidatus Aenigmarchaeota archaeon]|nr:RNA-binding protein [Candidatus Aenigmarchaeota archaeon]
MKCSSCNDKLLSEDDFTKFSCPSCLKSEIVRCKRCRLKSNVYVCPACGFRGP